MAGQTKKPLMSGFSKLMLAGLTGLEPATSGVTGQRSNQLSYNPASTAKAILHKLDRFVKTEAEKTCGHVPRGYAPPHITSATTRQPSTYPHHLALQPAAA